MRLSPHLDRLSGAREPVGVGGAVRKIERPIGSSSTPPQRWPGRGATARSFYNIEKQ